MSKLNDIQNRLDLYEREYANKTRHRDTVHYMWDVTYLLSTIDKLKGALKNFTDPKFYVDRVVPHSDPPMSINKSCNQLIAYAEEALKKLEEN